ncbi:hypothetical protein LCGC14_3030170, partial [marine sediment metagenome]
MLSEFNLKQRECLYVLSRIKKNYKNSGYPISKLPTNKQKIDLKAISKTETNEKHEVSPSIREYIVTKAERERREFLEFEASQRELLQDFFKPYKNQYRNAAVEEIRQITHYHDVIDLHTFILERKVFKKKLRAHQKKVTQNKPKAIIYPLLKVLPILGLIFSLLYTSFLPEALFFPNEVTSQFLLIPLVFYFSYLVIITKNRIRSRVSDLFYLPTSLGLPVVLGVSVLLGWLDFARLFIPISTILFCFIAF